MSQRFHNGAVRKKKHAGEMMVICRTIVNYIVLVRESRRHCGVKQLFFNFTFLWPKYAPR